MAWGSSWSPMVVAAAGWLIATPLTLRQLRTVDLAQAGAFVNTSLIALAREQLELAIAASSGRSAHTVFGGGKTRPWSWPE